MKRIDTAGLREKGTLGDALAETRLENQHGRSFASSYQILSLFAAREDFDGDAGRFLQIAEHYARPRFAWKRSHIVGIRHANGAEDMRIEPRADQGRRANPQSRGFAPD